MEKTLIEKIGEYWEFGAMIITGIAAFFGGRKTKKQNALTHMQQAYDRWVEDADERYRELKARIDDMNKELKAWEVKYKSLSKAFDKYRRENRN